MMTLYSGGEQTRPDYDSGALLVMPSLYYDDWKIDLPSLRALLSTMHLANSIATNTPPDENCSLLVDFIAKQASIAQAVPSSALTLFPSELLPHSAAPAAPPQKTFAPPRVKKTIWQLYNYGPKEFSQIQRRAASYKQLKSLEFCAHLAQRLFSEIEKAKFTNRETEDTPDIDGDRIVDFGCDLKLLLCWLSALGPVRCTVQPALALALWPQGPAVEDGEDLYVVVVASKGADEYGNRSLREIVEESERLDKPLKARYCLRRVDEDGKPVVGATDQVWIDHDVFRHALVSMRTKLTPEFEKHLKL
jgi:hypothetical protein